MVGYYPSYFGWKLRFMGDAAGRHRRGVAELAPAKNEMTHHVGGPLAARPNGAMGESSPKHAVHLSRFDLITAEQR